jgi:mannosyltransferase OCH1-like enzyme
MELVKFLVSRIIKIVANFLKLLCYVHHFLLPKQRFSLPGESPARCGQRGSPSAVPRILWQTNYTHRVTLAVYINYLFNRLLSPGFAYRFMGTEERAAFIAANFPPEIGDAYAKLQIGAAQADFWRVLVLQKHGGVYMDIDAHLVWPLGRIVKPDCEELYIRTKRGEISNYFIASRPGNPHLQRMLDVILKNIDEDRLRNVFEMTGPGVFNQVLDKTGVDTVSYRYSCNQGNFTNEFFQYIDKPQGKWTKAQEKMDIVKK